MITKTETHAIRVDYSTSNIDDAVSIDDAEYQMLGQRMRCITVSAKSPEAIADELRSIKRACDEALSEVLKEVPL